MWCWRQVKTALDAEMLAVPHPWRYSRPWAIHLVPDLVVGNPACGRAVGSRWSLRFLPTQTVLWLGQFPQTLCIQSFAEDLQCLQACPVFIYAQRTGKWELTGRVHPPAFPRTPMTDPTTRFSSLASYTPGISNNCFFLMHAEQIIFFVLFKFWVSLSTFFCITGDGQGWRKGSSEQSVRWSGRCLPQNLPHQRVCPNAASGRNLVLLLPFPDEWFNSQDNTGIYMPVDPLPLNVPRALTALWPLVCLSAPGTCSNLSTNRMIKGGSHTNNQRNVIVYTLKTAKENCQFCPKALETVFKSELPENRSNLT